MRVHRLVPTWIGRGSAPRSAARRASLSIRSSVKLAGRLTSHLGSLVHVHPTLAPDLPVMLKACGLYLGAARSLFLSTRALCATRAPRSFASNVYVSRGRRCLDVPSQSRPLASFRHHDPPATQSDEIRHDRSQPETLPSAHPVKRDIQPGGGAGPGGKAANDGQIETRTQGTTSPRAKTYDEIDARIREPQEFHAKIHPKSLERHIYMGNARSGMPVHDSTFDAVLSGRNLFLQVPGPGRWVQYLLPLGHKILERGIWRPRRVHEPEANPRPASAWRPTEVLAICPLLDDAKDAEYLGQRLFDHQAGALNISTLWRSMVAVLNAPGVTPPNKHLIHQWHRCNVLMAFPECLVQCLAIEPARARVLKRLRNVKTVVVDGRGKDMRRPDFFKMLGGIMDDLPLQQGTQRIVISYEHDPDLTRHLEGLFLSSDYEFHQYPYLEEIQARKKEARRKRQEYWRNRRRRPTPSWADLLSCPSDNPALEINRPMPFF